MTYDEILSACLTCTMKEKKEINSNLETLVMAEKISTKSLEILASIKKMTFTEKQSEEIRQALYEPQAYTLSIDSNMQFFELGIETLKKIPQENIEEIKNSLLNGIPPSEENKKQIRLIRFLVSQQNEKINEQIQEIMKINFCEMQEIAQKTERIDKIVLDMKTSEPGMYATISQMKGTENDEQEMTQARHSESMKITLSKLSQTLQDLKTDMSENALTTSKNPPTTITVSLADPGGEKYPLSFFHQMVEEAIGNLYEQGFTQISPQMVYRQLNGLDSNKKVSEKACETINEAIERLSATWAKIDFTEQMKLYVHDDNIKEVKFTGNIIMATHLTIKLKNSTVIDGWKIYREPLIYKYSKAIKQIATIKREILDTGESFKNSDTNMIMKYFLIQQILLMKKNSNYRSINFDKIFKTIEQTEEKSRIIKNKRKKTIEKMLEHFKNKEFIKNYTIDTNGQEKTGVTIEV